MKDTVDMCLVEGKNVKDPIVLSLINSLKEAMQPNAEYSSMAIDLLQNWTPLLSDLDLPQNV